MLDSSTGTQLVDSTSKSWCRAGSTDIAGLLRGGISKEEGLTVNPILTVALGVIALGLTIFLTIKQYRKWRAKKAGKVAEPTSKTKLPGA